MTKFKKGDRVMMKDGDDLPAGSVGTVLEDSCIPYVSWDGYTDGHDGDGLTNDNSVWAAAQIRLELISPPATEASDARELARP